MFLQVVHFVCSLFGDSILISFYGATVTAQSVAIHSPVTKQRKFLQICFPEYSFNYYVPVSCRQLCPETHSVDTMLPGLHFSSILFFFLVKLLGPNLFIFRYAHSSGQPSKILSEFSRVQLAFISPSGS